MKSLWKKPFKIALITPQYLGFKSNKGVAIHTFYLSKELAKLGCEVHIFTSGERSGLRKEYIGDGKRVIHYLPVKLKFNAKDALVQNRISMLIFDNEAIHQLLKEHEKGEFDIIHSHISMVGAFMAKHFIDTRWIHTFHSLEKNRLRFMTKDHKKYLGMEKWKESAMSFADALIAVSTKLREEFLETYPIDKNNVYYVPNGVDLSVFTPGSVLQKEKKVLYIGRFSAEKGIDVVLNIIEKVISADHEIKFELVAPPYETMPYLMEQIKKRLDNLVEKYPERIIWHKEALSREELVKLYQQCMVCIQPSRYESFGMTALEAMSCGKPVICSNKGGLPEVVGKAGILLPLNSSVFANKILKLSEDYKLRVNLGKKAFQQAQKFSWETAAEKTLDLYRATAKRREEKEGKHEALKNLHEISKKNGKHKKTKS
ncbi:MAG: glycosyltransferase family 4 protein [Candidatus Thorarchaeota archaeon]